METEIIALKQVCRCNICGNIVEVLHSGLRHSVLWQPMELLEAKTEDVGMEKYVPVIKRTDGTVKVEVGSTPHPMEENHHIEWTEILAEERFYQRYLKPGDKPEAEFRVEAREIKARGYCNIHGLWESM